MVLKVPAMGYNTWNHLRCSNYTALDVLSIAEKLEVLGFRERGYEYLNLDDCWATDVDEEGRLVADPAGFPDGMLRLSRDLKGRGFKFGLYGCRGYWTCAGRPGSRGREEIHAKQFAEWEVDFLKYDSCYSPNFSRQGAIDDYERMGRALKNSGRDIYYALCGWSSWYAPLHIGDQWRISADGDEWANIYVAVRTNEQLSEFAGPQLGFNDPDMLVGSSGESAVSLTPRQSRAQFALWSIMAAPLLLGASLDAISHWDLATYTNADVIAVDQDPLAIQGTVVRSTCPDIVVRDNWWCSPWSMPADVLELWCGVLNQVSTACVAIALVSLVMPFIFRRRRRFPREHRRKMAFVFLFLAILAKVYAQYVLPFYRPHVDECVQIWMKPLSPVVLQGRRSRKRAAVVFVNFESTARHLACDRGCLRDVFPVGPDAPNRLRNADRGPFIAKDLYAKREFPLKISEPLITDLEPHGDASIFVLTELFPDDYDLLPPRS